MSTSLNAQANCKHKNTSNGYGLAGGGLGAYEYCDDCRKILWKEQDESDAPTSFQDQGEKK